MCLCSSCHIIIYPVMIDILVLLFVWCYIEDADDVQGNGYRITEGIQTTTNKKSYDNMASDLAHGRNYMSKEG